VSISSDLHGMSCKLARRTGGDRGDGTVATVEARRHPLAHRSHFVRPTNLRDKTYFTTSWEEPSGESSLKAHWVVLVSLRRNVVVAAKVPMHDSH
jgi:hypothetical protein